MCGVRQIHRRIDVKKDRALYGFKSVSSLFGETFFIYPLVASLRKNSLRIKHLSLQLQPLNDSAAESRYSRESSLRQGSRKYR